MTKPIARVLAVLELLQQGGTRTVAELAARLGVDARTVRRYIGHLVDLGIPVESVRGRYGGYRLGPGYRMPPLMLTDEEALAVLLGLIAGRRAGLVTSTAAASESAAAKIRRVLPQPLRRRSEALVSAIDVTAPPGRSTPAQAGVLMMFADAALRRRPVAIGYTSQTGRRSERTVNPYGIVAHSGHWYVAGADSISGEVRTFRLDRVTGATELPGTFDVPDGFDPAAHVLSGIATAPHAHEVSVRVQGTAEQVRPLVPRGIVTIEGVAGETGWVRLTLQAERLDWVAPLLAWLGRPFVIERPDALRDHVRALAERLRVAGRVTASPAPP